MNPLDQSDLSTLFEFLPIGAYRSSPSGQILRINSAMVRLNGYTSATDLMADANISADWYIEPNRRAQFRALMERDGHVVDFVSEIHPIRAERRIWIREHAHAVRDKNGTVIFYEGTVEDITAHRAAQAELLRSEEHWKLALDSTGDGVWDWHIQAGQEFYSKRYKEMYGYSQDKVWQRSDDYADLVHSDDKAQLINDQQAYFAGQSASFSNEHRVRCADGSYKWVLSRGMVIAWDANCKPLRMIGTHTDISARKAVEALVWQQANFDALTGLPNRRMLRQRIEADIVRCQEFGEAIAVVFIDLDHFKEVNDTLGHDQGDLLLIQAAARIQACVQPQDTVARMGGDEFTLVLCDAANGPALRLVLQSILASMVSAFQLGAEQVFVSASLGVAIYPQDALLVEDLFKHADQALYVAKGEGRNRYSFFTPLLQHAAQTRARLASDLRLALPQQQFKLVYQPIVCLHTGAIHKAEALLRWHHPQRGLVSPAQFISIAESSGQIIEIGDWVFQQAALQVKLWRTTLHAGFQISVNKSPVQFHNESRVQMPGIAYLNALGLPGNSMAVEITEGLLLDASRNAGVTEHLHSLRQAGMAVSLDDFGTGYSSLTYLQKFAIDYVKIDQSFVRNLKVGSTDLALCQAIIAMAHALAMKVVAEGVETAEQRDLLVAAGCDFGQGYLFAHPMDAAAFEAFVTASVSHGGLLVTAAPGPQDLAGA